MKVKEIEDVNSVIQLHEKIFNKPFPLQSYYKKNSIYKVDIYVYEENSNLLGYSIVVDQEKEKNFYAWYGGVLPKFQGRGITEKFFKVLIENARKKGYKSITLATTNSRPNMIRLAVKMGFEIYDLKKRNYGEGNKIYFQYKILS